MTVSFVPRGCWLDSAPDELVKNCQRIQLARVLVQLWAHGGKGYLLLDEPTSSLDLPHQLATLKIARAHAAAGGGVLAEGPFLLPQAIAS